MIKLRRHDGPEPIKKQRNACGAAVVSDVGLVRATLPDSRVLVVVDMHSSSHPSKENRHDVRRS